MLDPDTFLTMLYVTCDDFFQHEDLPPPAPSAGRRASLSRSEVMTLGLFGQWFSFGGERGCWRWARRHPRVAFPALPAREQFNRLLRAAQDDLARFALALAEGLGAGRAAFEVVDSTGALTRDAKRRGGGWLWGQADIGYSNHLGWFEGLRVLAACTPQGVITGFCCAPATTSMARRALTSSKRMVVVPATASLTTRGTLAWRASWRRTTDVAVARNS